MEVFSGIHVQIGAQGVKTECLAFTTDHHFLFAKVSFLIKIPIYSHLLNLTRCVSLKMLSYLLILNAVDFTF